MFYAYLLMITHMREDFIVYATGASAQLIAFSPTLLLLHAAPLSGCIPALLSDSLQCNIPHGKSIRVDTKIAENALS